VRVVGGFLDEAQAMNVLLVYGVVTGGGCERRMGDIAAWLNAHGDQCHIACSQMDALGEAVLFGQCDVSHRQIHYYVTGEGGFQTPFMCDWIDRLVVETQADIIDVQWHPGFEQHPYAVPAVATLHGRSSIPPPSIFDGVISVDRDRPNPEHYRAGCPVIYNWVNLPRFPFNEEPGVGICFAGRAFKNINARKLLPFVDRIDGYGISNAPQTNMPENWHWHGFEDLARVFPKYQVVIGTAQVALEAMAAGRFVICGQSPHLPGMEVVAEGRLVTPGNVEELAQWQFSYRMPPEPTAEEVLAELLSIDRLEYPASIRRGLRDWVEQNHNIDTQVGAICDYYRYVIDRARVPHG
jgi:hypothetical protein